MASIAEERALLVEQDKINLPKESESYTLQLKTQFSLKQITEHCEKIDKVCSAFGNKWMARESVQIIRQLQEELNVEHTDSRHTGN